MKKGGVGNGLELHVVDMFVLRRGCNHGRRKLKEKRKGL